jgi:probable rRNA maturation factor
VAVALASDAKMRELNHRYRGWDRVTDVLAFGAHEAGETASALHAVAPSRSRTARPASRVRDRASRAPHLPTGIPHLGDIVIATGVARRQAAEAGHSYATELRVLALHGLLHLLGYDHHDRADAHRMFRAEARLRRRGGLAVGLIERATHGGANRRARR